MVEKPTHAIDVDQLRRENPELQVRLKQDKVALHKLTSEPQREQLRPGAV